MSSPGPMTFRPHLEERVWGGRNLARLGRELPEIRPIGESWEISSIAGRPSVVTRGPCAGLDLDAVLRSHGDGVLGDVKSPVAPFPLLLKLLDATQPLSVQLHPNDEEAVRLEGPGEGSVGKTEAWFVLEAAPGAEIIHGLAPGVQPADLYDRLDALAGGALSTDLERALFRWIPVETGDVIFIPAGTVHALGEGVVLAEVQQSSDITYRIYDWGRRDAAGRTRDLHIDKARGVRLARDLPCPIARIDDVTETVSVMPLLDCDKFRADLISVAPGDDFFATTAGEDGRGFHILFGWHGTTHVETAGGDHLDLAPLAFALLPAALGAYELRTKGPGARLIRIEGVISGRD